MKKFYKELLFALLALFTLNLIIYFTIIYPEVYEPYASTVEDVDHHNLIFADSHGWSLTNNNPKGKEILNNLGIDNLSYGSDSYFDIYFKINYLIQKDYKIDTIYLSIDPHMFGKKRINNNNKNRSIHYSSFHLYNEFFSISYAEFIVRKYLRKYLSTFDSNNSKLLQTYIESKIDSKPEQQTTNWNDLNDSIQNALSIKKFNNFYKAGISSKMNKVFKKILKICNEKEIEVILIKYPVAQSMKSMDIPNSFTLNYKNFDLQNYKIIEFNDMDDKYFANQDHVNSEGASLIIKKIEKFINDG